MKTFRVVSLSVAALALAACNKEVEEKLKTKTVYEVKEVEVEVDEPRNPETFKVTEKYGTLAIREGKFSGKSKITPWSSWWYPLNEKVLFYSNDGSASTLEKYDFYAQKRFQEDGDAALFEERNIYQENEVAWAGLCHAWAIASVLHPEPTETKHIGGVKWSVGDQKALLLKSYDIANGISDIMYGERYNGERDNDYDDIYPDQFHKLVQDHLIKKQMPFLMDYDARYPVWTVPVYRVNFTIKKVDANSADVDAWLTFASPHVEDLNYVGTKRVVKNYQYTLTGKWENDVFKVDGGEWTGDSKTDHPDYLISYPSSIERGSRNIKIKSEIVDSILK